MSPAISHSPILTVRSLHSTCAPTIRRPAGSRAAEALHHDSDPLVVSYRARLVEFATRRRLPAIYGTRDFVDAGGLMMYGPSIADLWRRVAYYMDKILKGAKPGNLPVEQPTKFELVINLKTAKALGLTIPQSVLLRADEVIQ